MHSSLKLIYWICLKLTDFIHLASLKVILINCLSSALEPAEPAEPWHIQCLCNCLHGLLFHRICISKVWTLRVWQKNWLLIFFYLKKWCEVTRQCQGLVAKGIWIKLQLTRGLKNGPAHSKDFKKIIVEGCS